MADADSVFPVTGPLRTTNLIRERVVEAVLGQSGINHAGLVAEIRRRFGSSQVADGALVREPVIEGAAPFKVDGRTFADCGGTLLHPEVIRAISSESAKEYRFPPDAQPYCHQIEAWEHLTAEEKRSVLVSSGTGSGKTECFLMPLLHDLVTEAEEKGQQLRGVRALALYPLNALIASQEERLRAWTAPFEGKVRFGLYNGLTRERPLKTERIGLEQVADRVTLRSNPPPILVTNVTMLEYMLVRRLDRELINNSKGKLRWIILDEAHSYIGSSAAEIALLLRRVLLTFGVRPEDVRFVATSATIGDGKNIEVTEELRRFLRDISGAPEDRVRVVTGDRDRVFLPAPAASSSLEKAVLRDRDAVAANPDVQAFIRVVEEAPQTLANVEALLRATGLPAEEVIAAIADDRDEQRGPLLPLRVHSFLRAVSGLWSCINPDCAQAPAEWAHGGISVERVDECPHCQSPVLEVLTCRECGEPYLDCEEREGRLQARYIPPTLDEFAALRERELFEDEEDGGGSDHEDVSSSDDEYDGWHRALATRALNNHRSMHVDPLTGVRYDREEEGTRVYYGHDPDECGACGAVTGEIGKVLRPFRFGAPFLIGNAAPVLLEGVEPRKLEEKAAYRPPAEGRQLLSFTDSRQGTARFAASLQTNAERGFVRGYIYHAVQGSMAAKSEDDPEIPLLKDDIVKLERAVLEAPTAPTAPILTGMIAEKKARLEYKLAPSADGILWENLRQRLAEAPEVHHWMAKVWGPRDERYKNSPSAFAEFLLLREFNRRPRRGNTLETMGLARLRFDAVDTAKKVPEALLEKGKTLADWQGLLYSIIDMAVRARFAIRADWNDVHWLSSRAPLSTLLPPGEQSDPRRELSWPKVGGKGLPSNLVLILEKALRLDRSEPRDRHLLKEVLEDAWNALLPAFSDESRPDYALDFAKARIAPVIEAWRCPVTRRVLPVTALGLTQYGHRDGLLTSNHEPAPLAFPQLPYPFPKGKEVEDVRQWLIADPQIAALREAGVWANLHDRVALLSPYMRSAEHSAQQPPARLRQFERGFKAGKINILNCSTTMEMGVDIGSVSAVMMTNVPPALANYRQRVGRAGRRRQGFASSLTYTRDTPLDRETFRDPEGYLARQTRAPRVKLDSPRIIQRHINSLLLARWFATEGGEALNAQAGAFFGCPEDVGTSRPDTPPVARCIDWLRSPSTESALADEVKALTRGTALAGDKRLFAVAAHVVGDAEKAVVREWEAMQAQAAQASPEGRSAIQYQLRSLARENLLKELVVRGVLPAHGLPTSVVAFVHAKNPSAGEEMEGGGDSQRRRSFPSRTLDIAIRDYAPGAEVVVDGLVYRSAGVTMNWLQPDDKGKASAVQTIKTYWTCTACGAADVQAVAPEHCPACHAAILPDALRRFLEPAGFTVDLAKPAHADTDEVSYVEPEPEEIVARGAAWQAMADPAQGRLRACTDGLVFYSSRGPGHNGYYVCLGCGRAEPVSPKEQRSGEHPLQHHTPLRGYSARSRDICGSAEKRYKITDPIALGHSTVTDVVELQPFGLPEEGTALAVVAALREALARILGIEASELGMAVRPVKTELGQRTHSLFLFDRSSGGAGFAPQAVPLYERLLADARKILDCVQPGCTNGCSACVLTADLHRKQDVLDRQGALVWAEATCSALADVSDADLAAPDAVLSRSVADEVLAALDTGVEKITVWAGKGTDVSGLSTGLFANLASAMTDRGVKLSLVVEAGWLDALDAAAKLSLRDAALTAGFELRRGAAPSFSNGAVAICAAKGTAGTIWASRDTAATLLGQHWGQAQDVPVVRFAGDPTQLTTGIDPNSLLPASGTQYCDLDDKLDGDLNTFGTRFGQLLVPAIRAVGAKGPVTAITYNDRYLQTPLVVRLLADVLAALRDTLGGAPGPVPARIITNPLKPNERQPFSPDHDWQWPQDRADVLITLLGDHGFAPDLLEENAAHGRVMTLSFSDGVQVRLILDQGLGPWRAPRFARFDFGDSSAEQAHKLKAFNSLIGARGTGYVVVT